MKLRKEDYENTYSKGGADDVTHCYPKEVIQIAKAFDEDKSKVLLLEHDVTAEVCIYVDKVWVGYLSERYKYDPEYMQDIDFYTDYNDHEYWRDS